jgi:hypothetical protein
LTKTFSYIAIIAALTGWPLSSCYAQTSRIISAPNQYTLDLSTLEKGFFKKERLSKEARKLAKLEVVDSINMLLATWDQLQASLDSIKELSVNLDEKPEEILKHVDLNDYLQSFDELAKDEQVQMLLLVAEGSSFEEYLGLADPEMQEYWEEYSEYLDELKQLIETGSSDKELEDWLNEYSDIIPEEELEQLTEVRSIYSESKVYLDSLKSVYTVLPADSIERAESVDSLNSLISEQKAAYISLIKDSEYLKESTYEKMLLQREEFTFFNEQQGQFAELEKDLENTKTQIQSFRDFSKFDKSLLSEHQELLQEFTDVDLKILDQAHEVLKAEKKANLASLLNIFGLNKINNPYSYSGTPLKKRIVLGGNLQIVQFENPFIIDLSPRIGFRLNKIFTTGVEFNYRASIGASDTTSSVSSSPTDMNGYRIYLDALIISGFFVHTEFESMTPVKLGGGDDQQWVWVNSFLAGIGKTYKIKSLVSGSVAVLYNFNKKNTFYKNRFQIRFGFNIN